MDSGIDMALPTPMVLTLTPESHVYQRARFLYVRSVVPFFVRLSPLFKVYCYMAIRPLTPKLFTDSEPPIKLLIGVPIIDDPDPPNRQVKIDGSK